MCDDFVSQFSLSSTYRRRTARGPRVHVARETLSPLSWSREGATLTGRGSELALCVWRGEEKYNTVNGEKGSTEANFTHNNGGGE